MLRASDIDIRQRAGLGFGRGVRLDFKGVPILYTPFISFPVGNQRKSGFLFPTIGTSSRSGSSLSVPWYWNIAPNYDATFLPTWFSKRGGKLDSEFRFLSDLGRGSLEAEYLPDDKEFGDSRSYVHFVDRSDFTDTAAARHRRGERRRQRLVRGLRPRPGRHEHQLPRPLGQPHLSHAALAGGAARAELPDDRRHRHSARAAAAHLAAAAGSARRLPRPAGRAAARSGSWRSATSRTTTRTS